MWAVNKLLSYAVVAGSLQGHLPRGGLTFFSGPNVYQLTTVLNLKLYSSLQLYSTNLLYLIEQCVEDILVVAQVDTVGFGSREKLLISMHLLTEHLTLQLHRVVITLTHLVQQVQEVQTWRYTFT